MVRSQIQKQRRHHRRGGFTLIEVLLVLGILVAIFAMVAPQLLGRRQEAMIKTSKVSIGAVEEAARMYAVEFGDYPIGNTDQAMELLMNPKDKKGEPMDPYLDKLPKDAWDNPIQYSYNGTNNTPHPTGRKPGIWSFGPNGADAQGQDDDVNNWDEYEDQ